MTKEEILEYATHTPHNTNKMVLSSMLDSFSKNGKVAYDTEQNLTPEEMQVARSNIDAIGRGEIFGLELIANPKNIQEVIANAKPNSIIRLEDGVYEEIDLCGTSFPENLTILGGLWKDSDGEAKYGATVKGIHVHSGLSQAYYWVNSDIRESILPKGLKIMNLYLIKDCVVENCEIEDLVISGCYFGRGAKITISPNSVNYNKAGRYSHATTMAKNVIIRGCRFVEAINADQASSILVQDTDGVTICRNSIENNAYYGVQVSRKADRKFGTGNVRITNNNFYQCTSRSIRISFIKNGDLAIIGNKITKLAGAKDDQIAISNCYDVSYVFKTGEGGGDAGNGNVCNGELATIDNGVISLTSMN